MGAARTRQQVPASWYEVRIQYLDRLPQDAHTIVVEDHQRRELLLLLSRGRDPLVQLPSGCGTDTEGEVCGCGCRELGVRQEVAVGVNRGLDGLVTEPGPNDVYRDAGGQKNRCVTVTQVVDAWAWS